MEDVGQFDDALRNVFNFALSLGDQGFVGVMANALLFCLEQCGLRERAVGIGLLEGGVVVGVLDGSYGAEGRGKAAEVAQF